MLKILNLFLLASSVLSQIILVLAAQPGYLASSYPLLGPGAAAPEAPVDKNGSTNVTHVLAESLSGTIRLTTLEVLTTNGPLDSDESLTLILDEDKQGGERGTEAFVTEGFVLLGMTEILADGANSKVATSAGSNEELIDESGTEGSRETTTRDEIEGNFEPATERGEVSTGPDSFVELQEDYSSTGESEGYGVTTISATSTVLPESSSSVTIADEIFITQTAMEEVSINEKKSNLQTSSAETTEIIDYSTLATSEEDPIMKGELTLVATTSSDASEEENYSSTVKSEDYGVTTISAESTVLPESSSSVTISDKNFTTQTAMEKVSINEEEDNLQTTSLTSTTEIIDYSTLGTSEEEYIMKGEQTLVATISSDVSEEENYSSTVKSEGYKVTTISAESTVLPESSSLVTITDESFTTQITREKVSINEEEDNLQTTSLTATTEIIDYSPLSEEGAIMEEETIATTTSSGASKEDYLLDTTTRESIFFNKKEQSFESTTSSESTEEIFATPEMDHYKREPPTTTTGREEISTNKEDDSIATSEVATPLNSSEIVLVTTEIIDADSTTTQNFSGDSWIDIEDYLTSVATTLSDTPDEADFSLETTTRGSTFFNKEEQSFETTTPDESTKKIFVVTPEMDNFLTERPTTTTGREETSTNKEDDSIATTEVTTSSNSSDNLLVTTAEIDVYSTTTQNFLEDAWNNVEEHLVIITPSNEYMTTNKEILEEVESYSTVLPTTRGLDEIRDFDERNEMRRNETVSTTRNVEVLKEAFPAIEGSFQEISVHEIDDTVPFLKDKTDGALSEILDELVKAANKNFKQNHEETTEAMPTTESIESFKAVTTPWNFANFRTEISVVETINGERVERKLSEVEKLLRGKLRTGRSSKASQYSELKNPEKISEHDDIEEISSFLEIDHNFLESVTVATKPGELEEEIDDLSAVFQKLENNSRKENKKNDSLIVEKEKWLTTGVEPQENYKDTLQEGGVSTEIPSTEKEFWVTTSSSLLNISLEETSTVANDIDTSSDVQVTTILFEKTTNDARELGTDAQEISLEDTVTTFSQEDSKVEEEGATTNITENSTLVERTLLEETTTLKFSKNNLTKFEEVTSHVDDISLINSWLGNFWTTVQEENSTNTEEPVSVLSTTISTTAVSTLLTTVLIEEISTETFATSNQKGIEGTTEIFEETTTSTLWESVSDSAAMSIESNMNSATSEFTEEALVIADEEFEPNGIDDSASILNDQDSQILVLMTRDAKSINLTTNNSEDESTESDFEASTPEVFAASGTPELRFSSMEEIITVTIKISVNQTRRELDDFCDKSFDGLRESFYIPPDAHIETEGANVTITWQSSVINLNNSLRFKIDAVDRFDLAIVQGNVIYRFSRLGAPVQTKIKLNCGIELEFSNMDLWSNYSTKTEGRRPPTLLIILILPFLMVISAIVVAEIRRRSGDFRPSIALP